MSLLSGAGKDAGLSASQELHKTADDALDKVRSEVLPAAEKAIEGATDHATYGLAAVVADLANRLNGAELPLDITIEASAKVRIYGKVGGLKLSQPEYDSTVRPSDTVVG